MNEPSGIGEGKKNISSLTLSENKEETTMEREGSYQTECLASIADSGIFRCKCGGYHVRVNETTLHLTASQFNATARLFKLVLGMLVSHAPASNS